jgi:hypothetical protein
MTKTMHQFSYDYFKNDPKIAKAPITRIELTEQRDGSVFVSKFKEGWKASTPAYESYTTNDQTFDEMVAWFNDNGWNHREWYSLRRGKRCRAFLGKPEPVRTREDIQKMRTMVSTGKMIVPNTQDELAIWYDYSIFGDRISFLRLTNGEIEPEKTAITV